MKSDTVVQLNKKKLGYIKPRFIVRKIKFSLFLSSKLLACCSPAECGKGLCGEGSGCLPGFRCVLQCCVYP